MPEDFQIDTYDHIPGFYTPEQIAARSGLKLELDEWRRRQADLRGEGNEREAA